MAITINGAPVTPEPAPRKKASTHTQPQVPPVSLDEPGRLRIAHVLYVLDLSQTRLSELRRASWYGFPEPDGHEKNHPYWHTETIKAYLARGPRKRRTFSGRPRLRTLSLPDGTVVSLTGALPEANNPLGSQSGSSIPETGSHADAAACPSPKDSKNIDQAEQ